MFSFVAAVSARQQDTSATGADTVATVENVDAIRKYMVGFKQTFYIFYASEIHNGWNSFWMIQ